MTGVQTCALPICLAIDLYANQYGCDLENVSTFAKYLGGSSGNVVFAVAPEAEAQVEVVEVGRGDLAAQ